MKKAFVVLLVAVLSLSTMPITISADQDTKRIEVVPCSGSSLNIEKTGNHFELYELLGIGCAPGDSYTVNYSMTDTITTSAGVSILEGLWEMGVDTSISTSASIGVTVTNNSNVTSEAALWVSFDHYEAVELAYIGNGTCAVYRDTVEVPDYYVYGFENSY